MMVWLNAWPMCSVPVTLGGGNWMENEARPPGAPRATKAGGAIAALFFPLRAPVGFQGFTSSVAEQREALPMTWWP